MVDLRRRMTGTVGSDPSEIEKDLDSTKWEAFTDYMGYRFPKFTTCLSYSKDFASDIRNIPKDIAGSKLVKGRLRTSGVDLSKSSHKYSLDNCDSSWRLITLLSVLICPPLAIVAFPGPVAYWAATSASNVLQQFDSVKMTREKVAKTHRQERKEKQAKERIMKESRRKAYAERREKDKGTGRESTL